MKKIVLAIVLSIFLTAGTLSAHEGITFKHATGTISICGMQYYLSYRIWELTEDRGYIAVIYNHGLLHITKPYKDIEDLKRMLRGD